MSDQGLLDVARGAIMTQDRVRFFQAEEKDVSDQRPATIVRAIPVGDRPLCFLAGQADGDAEVALDGPRL